MSLLPADLRLRLVTALAVLLALTPLAHLAPAAAALGAVLALYALTRTAPPWRRLWHLEGFLVLLLLTLPFTVPGQTLWQLGPLTASTEGLARALLLGCKIAASVLFVTLLFAAIEPGALGGALRALRLPEALVRLFLGLTRYLGLIRAEFARLQEAMRMRAFTPRSNRHTWRSYGYLIGMLLVRAMDRAERIDEAMRMRGAARRFARPVLPHPTARDWALAAALCLGAALLLIWDRT